MNNWLSRNISPVLLRSPLLQAVRSEWAEARWTLASHFDFGRGPQDATLAVRRVGRALEWKRAFRTVLEWRIKPPKVDTHAHTSVAPGFGVQAGQKETDVDTLMQYEFDRRFLASLQSWKWTTARGKQSSKGSSSTSPDQADWQSSSHHRVDFAPPGSTGSGPGPFG